MKKKKKEQKYCCVVFEDAVKHGFIEKGRMIFGGMAWMVGPDGVYDRYAYAYCFQCGQKPIPPIEN